MSVRLYGQTLPRVLVHDGKRTTAPSWSLICTKSYARTRVAGATGVLS